jgi:hypothetical protein
MDGPPMIKPVWPAATGARGDGDKDARGYSIAAPASHQRRRATGPPNPQLRGAQQEEYGRGCGLLAARSLRQPVLCPAGVRPFRAWRAGARWAARPVVKRAAGMRTAANGTAGGPVPGSSSRPPRRQEGVKRSTRPDWLSNCSSHPPSGH